MPKGQSFVGKGRRGRQAAHEKLRDSDIWQPVGEGPILGRGSGGAWDSTAAVGFSLAAEEGRYRVWYEGRMPTGGDGRRQVCAQVGHAVSTDGRHWEKSPAAVLPVGKPGSWDSEHVYSPDVRKTEGGYRLYYHGNAESSGACDIGMALSVDGVAWERAPSNPVLRRGRKGEPDELLVACPNVLQARGGLAMIYCQAGSADSGELWTIGLAFSEDGLEWRKQGTVISLAEQGRCISAPTVVRVHGRYYLWAWAFSPADMEKNVVRLFCSEDLQSWKDVWESGWVPSWLPAGVSRQFFMPRVWSVDEDELWMLYPVRIERGIADTGLAVARLWGGSRKL